MDVTAHAEFEGKLKESAASSSPDFCCRCFSGFICSIWCYMVPSEEEEKNSCVGGGKA